MNQMSHGIPIWREVYLALAMQMPRRRRLSPGRAGAVVVSPILPWTSQTEGGGRIMHSLVLLDDRIR